MSTRSSLLCLEEMMSSSSSSDLTTSDLMNKILNSPSFISMRCTYLDRIGLGRGGTHSSFSDVDLFEEPAMSDVTSCYSLRAIDQRITGGRNVQKEHELLAMSKEWRRTPIPQQLLSARLMHAYCYGRDCGIPDCEYKWIPNNIVTVCPFCNIYVIAGTTIGKVYSIVYRDMQPFSLLELAAKSYLENLPFLTEKLRCDWKTMRAGNLMLGNVLFQYMNKMRTHRFEYIKENRYKQAFRASFINNNYRLSIVCDCHHQKTIYCIHDKTSIKIGDLLLKTRLKTNNPNGHSMFCNRI